MGNQLPAEPLTSTQLVSVAPGAPVSRSHNSNSPSHTAKNCILSCPMLSSACVYGQKQPCINQRAVRIRHQVCCVFSLLVTKLCMQSAKGLLEALNPPCHWVECAFSLSSLSMHALSSAGNSAEAWLCVPCLPVHHSACAVALLCGTPHLWARSGVSGCVQRWACPCPGLSACFLQWQLPELLPLLLLSEPVQELWN